MSYIPQFPDASDTASLLSYLRQQIASLPTPDQFAENVIQEFSTVRQSTKSLALYKQFWQLAYDLYEFEQYRDIPPPPPHSLPLEEARYRDELLDLIFRISDPRSTINVLQALAVMILTNISDHIPRPYDQEIAQPDGQILVIHKMRSIATLVNELLTFCDDELVKESANIYPRLRAKLIANNTPASSKIRSQVLHDFTVSPIDVVSSHFKDTPLIRISEIKVPFRIPADFRAELGTGPFDPDHPKHYCYQCKRSLPHDFAFQYWQETDFTKGPFFHTENCRNIVLNRHRAVNGDYIDTYRSLMKEYMVFIRNYENNKKAKDDAMQEKQLIDRDRIEERDYKDWQRDQERAVTRWEKEHEKALKEQEAAKVRLAEETRWAPHPFKP